MPRDREFVVDEVQTAEALVAFYEKRLAEARDRLATAQKKPLTGGGRVRG